MAPVPDRSILVVDDDRDVRTALRDSLEDAGYRVAAVSDGGHALSYLQANGPPSLILLDWNMSPMNAQQFMATFEKDPSFDAVPVVLVTADVHRERKLKSGRFSDYLSKPVDLDVLFSVVKRLTTT